jgi:FKBP12-rapamycin complex-associated protein
LSPAPTSRLSGSSSPQLVSSELIRIAILWHEQWHEALEEASRLYFGESNVEGMLGVLLPLHEMMETNGPTTLKEIAFVQVGVGVGVGVGWCCCCCWRWC